MKKTILTAVITTLVTIAAVWFIGSQFCCKSEKCSTEQSCESSKKCTKGKDCKKGKTECKPGCEKPCCKKKSKCGADCTKPCCADKKAEETSSSLEDAVITTAKDVVTE